MRVIGIDPGLRNLGWGVIDVAGARLAHVANGICHSAPGRGPVAGAAEGDLALRLLSLYEQLTAVVARYHPDAAAVEHTFVNKDAVATLKLGQARGIALLVPAQAGHDGGRVCAQRGQEDGRGRGPRGQAPGRPHGARPPAPASRSRGRTRPTRSPSRSATRITCNRPGGSPRRWHGPRDDRQDRGAAGYRGPDHVLIDVRGGGLRVHVSDRTLAAMPRVGEGVALFTELMVREDLLQLFGFPTMLEKEWHRLLVTVQGVGARAAMAILGALGPEGVARAIALGDARAVQAAPGIGPKIASRVILELKSKAPALMALGADAGVSAGAALDAVVEAGAPRTPPPAAAVPSRAAHAAEALSALVNLGYGQGDAAQAVAQAAGQAPDAETGALIRTALRALAPKG